MSDFSLSKTAKQRLEERHIGEDVVSLALSSPERVQCSARDQNFFLYWKIYFHEKFEEKRLLLVFCRKKGSQLHVFTVVDTKNIDQYF